MRLDIMEKLCLLSIFYLFSFVNGYSNSSPDPNYIPENLILCNETNCIEPPEAYMKCIFNSIDTDAHKRNYSGLIYKNSTDKCCPFLYSYTEHALDTTCVPYLEVRGCGVYPYDDTYICRELDSNSMNPKKKYEFKCIENRKRCPTTCVDNSQEDEDCKCFTGSYWCSLQNKCIPDEEYCNCGKYNVKCPKEMCLSPKLIKPNYKISIYRICPDGNCIKTKRTEDGEDDCKNNTSNCKDGHWKCGSFCKPNSHMKTHRVCGDECIDMKLKCLKKHTLMGRSGFGRDVETDAKTARPSYTTPLPQTNDIDITAIAIGTSVGGVTIVICIIAIFIYKWKKKRRAEILYVDDNPMYDYAAADYEYSATDIVDNNEYYEADSDEETKM